MREPQSIQITFYTKPGCHLCEDVEEQLESLATRWQLNVHSIDITTDFELHRRYWDKIPVVIVAGHTLQAPIRLAELAGVVAQAAQSER